MNILARIATAMLIIALAIWLAAIMSAGIAAANVFPTMDDWPVHTDSYAALEPSIQSRLLAGHIMDGVFHSVGIAMMLAAAAATASLITIYITSPAMRGITGWLLGTLVGIAAAMIVYYAMLLPEMQQLLELRWEAARIGDSDRLQDIAVAFDPKHKLSNLLLQIQLVCIVGALMIIGCSHNSQQRRADSRTD